MPRKKKAEQVEEQAEEQTTTEAVQEKPKQPNQNGVTRPKDGTATGRVWQIADELSANKGEPAARSDVMAAGKAEGLNEATIATQYGRWRKFFGLGRSTPVAKPADEPEAPAEVEEEGDEPTASVEEDDEEYDEDEE